MKNTQNVPQNHLDVGQIVEQANRLPNQPCIYYLINGNDEITFVGKTLNLYEQLVKHRAAGKNFVRYSTFPCNEADLDRLEQEAIVRLKPLYNQQPARIATSQLLTKSFICLKHNITPAAFDYLREAFGLMSVHSFGQTKYYKPEDVAVWLGRFKGLVLRGRHVLQVRPHYVAVGISERTKQIQLYKIR